jgi:hypothetical protein
VGGAHVSLVNLETGLVRNLIASEVEYGAAALPSGIYQVTVEAAGFRRLEGTASVAAGMTTTRTLTLQLGELTEKEIVDDAVPLIRYDHH